MKVLALVFAVLIIGAWSQTNGTTPAKPRSGCWSSQEWNSTLGDCQACPSNCSTCSYNVSTNVDTCTSCSYTTNFLNSVAPDRYSCGTCVPNCRYCRGPTAADCTEWNSGYKFNSILNQSFACPSNCLVCSADNVCQKCITNYFLDANKACTWCAVTGCAECNQTSKCTKCTAANYLTATGYCSSCSTGCTSCDGTGVCSKCADGYFLNAATKQCDRCSDSLCTKCSTAVSKCDTCTAKYYLASNGNCTACAANCLACTGDGDTCTMCAASTGISAITLNAGKCTVCNATGCAACDGTGACTMAMPGYWLNADKTVTACGGNCANCSSNTTCAACKPDSQYSLRPDGICDWSTTAYRANYWTAANGSAYDSSKANTDDWNCQYAYGYNLTGNDTSRNKNATCTQCETGYYLDKNDWKCKPCTAGCSTCQMLNGYVTCLTKNSFNGAFIWYNGTLNKTKSWAGDVGGYNVCPAGCKLCTPTTQVPALPKECTVCMPGYYLQWNPTTGDKKCISNTLPCENYDGTDAICFTNKLSGAMLAFNAIILAVLGFLYL